MIDARIRETFEPMIRMALPIALQMLMQTLLNVFDTVMVGRLGEIEIGAIALGNQVHFLVVLFLFGVGSGAAVFASQYWGNGDTVGVRRSLGISLVFGLVGSGLVASAVVFAPRALLSVFTTDRAVIHEGSRYLRIVGPSYLFTAVTICYSAALRSVGNTRLPMYATVISIVINVVGNYLLIFGAFGFPRLAVAGAAVATASARLVEMLVVLGAVYRGRGPVAARVHDLLSWDKAFFSHFAARAVPVIGNDLFWALGFTMYTVVFGRLGTEYLATYNIADTIGRLTLVLFIGTAHATQIMIGNDVGAGRLGKARATATLLMQSIPIASTMIGLILFFPAAAVVPQFFRIGEPSRALLSQFIRLYALLIIVKVLNIHIITGILRGGADTRVAFLIDVVPLWAVGVPLAFLLAFVLGVPPLFTYGAFFVEETIRCVVGIGRIRSGKWMHVITDTSPRR